MLPVLVEAQAKNPAKYILYIQAASLTLGFDIPISWYF